MQVIKSAGKTAKADAKKVAQQIAREPWEILKDVSEQLTGTEADKPQSETNAPQEQRADFKNEQEKVKSRDSRIVEGLEFEMKEIRDREHMEKEQARLAEEREKLALQNQPKDGPRLQPKRGRRLGGWGQKLKQLVSKSETRQPPSG